MQPKLQLSIVGILDGDETMWKSNRIFKVNRIHVPLEGKAIYSGLKDDFALEKGFAYVLTGSDKTRFHTVQGHKYYHLFFDFYSMPPIKPEEYIRIDLSKDDVMRSLFDAAKYIICNSVKERNKFFVSTEHPGEFAQLSRILDILVSHLNINYSLAFVQNKNIEKALVFMEENYSAQISNGDIANYLHVDVRYLLRLFSKHIHMSPYQYLRQCRIEHAIVYLNEGRSVSDTAYLCGYQSDNAFRISFKKVTGYTPSEMIKRKY